jgi:uncharacterized protein Usg
MTLQNLLYGMELTSAEVLYHLPDHPDLLQLFLWQEYDRPPNFPRMLRFLNYWERELDGQLHSVKIVSAGNLIIPRARLVSWMAEY